MTEQKRLTDGKYRVFVYGTLMAGFGNNRLLQYGKATFLGPATTLPQFTLISLGGFPGLLRGGETAVQGEVYEVDIETLTNLDRLEGHPHWYRREPVALEDGREIEGYIYLQPPPKVHVVESGSWRQFRGRE